MAQYYCPDCECVITLDDSIGAPAGCTPTTGGGSHTGGGGTVNTGDTKGGTGTGNGNSSFGIMPFGLGLGDFGKDMCKLLPDGFCDLIKKIIVIIIVVLLIMGAMKIYKTFKK